MSPSFTRGCILALAILCGTFPAASQSADVVALERAQQERKDAERELQTILRSIAPELESAQIEETIRARAFSARVAEPAIAIEERGRRLPIDGARIMLHEVKISGRGAYGDVDRFFNYLLLGPRAARLESFELNAEGGDAVRYRATLIVPVFGGLPESDTTESGKVADLKEEARRRRALVGELGRFLDPSRERFLDLLAAFHALVDEEPVAVTRASFNGRLTIEGALLGASAQAAVTSATATLGGEAASERLTPRGRCRSFTIRLSRVPEDVADEVALGNGAFDSRIEDVCAPVRQEPKRIEVRGAAGSESAEPVLRLRNVSMSGVFFVLNDLLNESFVLHPEVEGAVTLEVFEGATIEEVLAAIESAGVEIGEGPLRRVTPSGAELGESISLSLGPPVTIAVTDIDVADLLCVVSEVSGRSIRMPLDLDAEVSVFAWDTDVNAIVAAVAEVLGVTAMEAAGRLNFGRTVRGAASACERPRGPEPRLLRSALGPEEIVVADLELVGVARAGEEWRAYLRVPSGQIIAAEAAQAFRDGIVHSVDERAIVVTDLAGERRELTLRR